MKSSHNFVLIILVLCGLTNSSILKAQDRSSTLPANLSQSVEDSLAGYNEAAFISELKANNIEEPEYTNYLNYTKRVYKNEKYHLTNYEPSPTLLPTGSVVPTNTSPPKGYSSASTNAAACVNEDFESTAPGFYGSSITGWTIDWTGSNGSTCTSGFGWSSGATQFQIRSTPINNPFPAINSFVMPNLSSISASPFGGNVAQLGDFNPNPSPGSLRTRIRKSFTVTAANQFFQFAFFGVWQAPGHACCLNPSFSIKFYDCSGNILPCGSYLVEPEQGCINSGGTPFLTCPAYCYNFWPQTNQSAIMCTPWWQQRYVNLTQYIGQCITVEFINSNCPYVQHVGAVFLDCQCTGSNPAGTQLVGSHSQVIPAPSSQTICIGQQATMNVSGATSYKWYRISPSYQYMGTGSSQVVTPGIGTYIYSVSAVPGLCNSASSATLKVVVVGPPIMGIGCNPDPACLGQTVKLTAIAGHPCSWSWLNFPSNSATVLVTPGVNSVYSVTAKSLINGCMRTITVMPVVIPKPNVTAVANPIALCQGGQFTLTASGGGTYVWTPFSSIVNPYIVNVNNTTTYTVTGVTSAPNCNGTATVQAIVLQNPTVTVSPNAVCTGVTNTVTASGAVNYTFYIGGTNPATLTSQVITINPTSATPYTLCGAVPGATTCMSCITGVIPVGTVIPLSASNVTLCDNGGPCVTLNASSTVTPVNFNWQPISQNGTSVTVCPTVSTQYTVYATSTALGNCPNFSIVNVTYTTGNCCPNPPASLITLSNINGTYQNNSYLLNNTQSLWGNANFVNAEVWITPGVQLTVPTGSVLNLENTHMFACGINMWQGIKIIDGGRITTSNTRFSNSMIEDAEVAIELDGINSANVVAGQPAIDISRVIFNKNYIGIKISNSDPFMDSLALGITGCVFTSRDLPYTTAPGTLSWPSSSNATGSGGLRLASSPTTGLVPPYNMNLYNQANLKLPHNFQTGHIGIKIENIGDPLGFNATPGVQFGITYLSSINPDFNLFDGLGNGIDVTDASLTTANNVFQNSQQYLLPPLFTNLFGGDGIRHEITGIRNTRLKLTSLTNTSDGNQFWNCHKGVEALNVFETRIRNSIFRSTHTKTPPVPLFILGLTPGDIGIESNTNRFDFNVHESEFNNVRVGIVFNTPSTPQLYDMTGNNTQTGIFAQGFNIQSNYFGSQVFSNVPLSNEYMSDAVIIQAPPPTTGGWQNNTAASYISSNKFNRIYRGVHIDGMNDHPMFIGGNEFLLEDDYVYGPPDFAWGVKVENNMDNMAIVNNTVQGQGSMPFNEVSAILCENNYGVMSPLVSCNLVLDCKYGFEFSGLNQSTVWQQNEMCNHFAGLALTDTAIIGQQGGNWGGNGNLWNTICTWAPGVAPFGNWQTYCENGSNPANSKLYVFSPSSQFEPTIHGSSAAPAYANGVTVLTVSTNSYSDCMVWNPYPAPPSWRTASATGLDQSKDEKGTAIRIYPNPTKGTVFVSIPNSEGKFKVSVSDLTGKHLIDILSENANQAEVDLGALPAAVYFLEIQRNDKSVIHKKVIKMD
jgi:hypothetical protein